MRRKDDLDALCRLLGVKFRNLDLLDEARTHKLAAEMDSEYAGFESYERLEILGDSILAHIVLEDLFAFEPKLNTRQLNDVKSILTSNKLLWIAGLHLGIGPFIHSADSVDGVYYGSSDEKDVPDVMEALIAAIYLDRGFRAARSFVRRNILVYFQSGRVKMPQEPGELLSSLAKLHFGEDVAYISYTVRGEEKREGVYRADAIVGTTRVSVGKGPTLKEAEIDAACRALRDYFKFDPRRQ